MAAKGSKGRIKTPGVPYVKTEKGYCYYYVTLGPGRRKTLHRLNWEAAHGPVPAGHVIRFRDGNTLNCALSNLYTCTRGQVGMENRDPARCFGSAHWRQVMASERGAQIRARKSETMRRTWQSGRFPVGKRTQTLLNRIKAGEVKPGFNVGTPRQIAYWLFPDNAGLREFVIETAPDLIEARRAVYMLKKITNSR